MKYEDKKVWLESEQVDRMLAIAKNTETRDYLMLLLFRYGLRCGEVVGTGSNLGNHRDDPNWKGLPGIKKENLRDRGLWVKGKGYERGIVQDTLYNLPNEVMDLLRGYSSQMQDSDSLFKLSEKQAERLVKKYAQLAGVEDWQRLGPHRLRAFFNTDMEDRGVDLDKRQKMMRHSSYRTTLIYQNERKKLPDEVTRRILESLAQSKREPGTVEPAAEQSKPSTTSESSH